MTERVLLDYADRTERTASRGFTTNVFAGIGLDRYARAASELGEVYIAWNARGVSAVRTAAGDAAFEAWFGERFERRAVRALEEDDPTLDCARQNLGGKGVDVPLDLAACSPFEAAVLKATSYITRGNARSYGWLARELHAAQASRAVGKALGRNPVPLLIPCHRVIRADNAVGGYVFGSDVKRRLLEAEGVDFEAVEGVARRGFRYVACSDGTFCLPTCGDVARRIDMPGYLGLHSAHEAHARGLEPCSTCRPVAAA